MSHTLRHSQKTYFLSVTYQSAVLQGSFCISELHLSQKIFLKIPLKENLSKTYFSENKKTHLRNIHCPADMSESKVTFCFTSYSVNAGSLQLRLNPYPLPLPAARPHAFDKYFRFRKASPAQFVLLISHSVECNAVQREYKYFF